MKDNQGFCFDRSENYCNFNQNAEKSIILIGDSHSEVLSDNLYKKIKTKNINFTSINRGSCIFLPNVKKIYSTNKKEFEKLYLKK